MFISIHQALALPSYRGQIASQWFIFYLRIKEYIGPIHMFVLLIPDIQGQWIIVNRLLPKCMCDLLRCTWCLGRPGGISVWTFLRGLSSTYWPDKRKTLTSCWPVWTGFVVSPYSQGEGHCSIANIKQGMVARRGL